MNRRSFFSSGLKEIIHNLFQTPIGQIANRRLQALANILAPESLNHYVQRSQNLIENQDTSPSSTQSESNFLCRPPGSLKDPVAFNQSCTRCGDCQAACPYGVIQSDSQTNSGPFIDPNAIACHLCTDFPCIAACKEDALIPLDHGYLPSFGKAALITERCINWKNQGACNSCQTNCPVPDAITYNTQTLPVFTEYCTGCGLCRSICPTIPVAIKIKNERIG